MNRLVIPAFLTLVGLSSCGTPPVPSSSGQAMQAQATGSLVSTTRLFSFSLMCPPDATHKTWWNCGKTTLKLYSSGMPGNIIPADFIVQGDKAAFNGLGQSFKAQLPASGYTKFYVNNLLVTVDALDKDLFSAIMAFDFKQASQLKDGSYEFDYSGQVYPAR